MKERIALILIFLFFSPNTFAYVGSIGFNKILDRVCNESCTLEPLVGTPFHIEYRIERRGSEEKGFGYFTVITLNGKTFKPLRTAYSPINGRLPFHQNLFFDNHRFQIFSLTSSRHISTEYLFYFVREGDTFHLLGDEAFPGISYGCGEATARHPNGCFHANVGYGRGQYFRQNYKLDGHRLIEID